MLTETQNTKQSELSTQVHKVIFLGESDAGKSEIWKTLQPEDVELTTLKGIKTNFFYDTVSENNILYKTSYWDLHDGIDINEVDEKYFLGSWGVVICYDLTDISSFNKLNTWICNILDHIRTESIPILILGCKSDLYDPNNSTHVSLLDVEKLKQQLSLRFGHTIPIISAITFENNVNYIRNLFDRLRLDIHYWSNQLD